MSNFSEEKEHLMFKYWIKICMLLLTNDYLISGIRKKIGTLKHRCLQRDFDSRPWGRSQMCNSALNKVLIAQL
jgi:hypothetical protein